MKIRPNSLFRRLIASMAGVLGIGAIALGWAAWTYARHAADEAFDRLLVGAALQIAESVTVLPGRVSVDPPVSAFETLALAANDRVFYRVIGPTGETLTGHEDLAVMPRKGRTRGARVFDGNYRDFPIRLVSIERGVTGPGVSGFVGITVAQTRLARQELAFDLAFKAMSLIGAMTGLAFAAVIVAVRHALGPLDTVRAALLARDPRDVSAVIVDAPSEVGALIEAINHFLERLSERIRGMERFIADAAHQIRTPLTALTAQSNLLATETDLDKRLYRIARIQMRTEQLGRLTSQLLSHAMVIHRREVVPPEPLELTPLLRKALNESVPHSLGRDINVIFEGCAPDLVVAGDRVSLGEALSNIISNAVRHGAPTWLRVTLARSGTFAVIDITDDGPGIAAAHWNDVVKPFVRLNEAHAGSGLGLAIAHDVVTAHSGRLSFAHRSDKCFSVSVSLPLATQSPSTTAQAE